MKTVVQDRGDIPRQLTNTLVGAPVASGLAASAGAEVSGVFHIDPYVKYADPASTLIYPDTVVIGDVIGDVRPDVVLVTVGPYGGSADYMVYIYEQKPGGSLAAPIKVSYLVRTGRTGLDLADLDSDGRAEIIVGHDYGLTVIKRVGTQFSAKKIAGALPAFSLGILDIDHDGHPDVFAQSWSDGADIYFGDGFGGFREVQRLATSAFGYNTVEVRDFTGDRLKDVILTNGQGFSKAWVYANDPVSGLKPAKTFDLSNLLRYPPWGVTVADFNKDGRPDMALSDSGDQTNAQTGVLILYQDATGELVNPIKLPSARAPEPVAAADLDGNGLTDVVTLYGSWNQMAYYLQRPGGFDPAVTMSTTTTPWFNAHYKDNSLVLGDVNSDGCIDIVVADPSSGLLVYPVRNCQIELQPTSGSCLIQVPVIVP